MLDLQVSLINSEELSRAFRSAPEILQRKLGSSTARAAQEVAREEKKQAPKADGTLANSILARQESALSHLVGPSVEYADAVENETEPGAGPSVRSILDWIKVKGITPDDPNMKLRDLAFIIARSIAFHGTPASPYAEPTVDAMRGRVNELINNSVAAGLSEAGLI